MSYKVYCLPHTGEIRLVYEIVLATFEDYSSARMASRCLESGEDLESVLAEFGGDPTGSKVPV